MLTTMQDRQLTVHSIFQHGATIYSDSRIAEFDGDRVRRASYGEIAARTARLATGLRRLGIRPGDRVGTFCWNTPEHLEAYFAIPSMGAVLHTLNLRLFPDQLAFVINHAEDQVVIVDQSLIPLLARVVDQLKTVEQYVVVGAGGAGAGGPLGDAAG